MMGGAATGKAAKLVRSTLGRTFSELWNTLSRCSSSYACGKKIVEENCRFEIEVCIVAMRLFVEDKRPLELSINVPNTMNAYGELPLADKIFCV